MDTATAVRVETRLGFATRSPRACCVVREDPRDTLTPNDRKQVEKFRRFLGGERSHEIVAWALCEPMTSANDPDSYGMGC